MRLECVALTGLLLGLQISESSAQVVQRRRPQQTESSTTTAVNQASEPERADGPARHGSETDGAMFAEDVAAFLSDERLDEEDIMARFQHLDSEEQQRFLQRWAQIVPPRGIALGLYQRLARAAKRKNGLVIQSDAQPSRGRSRDVRQAARSRCEYSNYSKAPAITLGVLSAISVVVVLAASANANEPGVLVAVGLVDLGLGMWGIVAGAMSD